MGGRYEVTGAQLGMLLAFNSLGKQEEICDLLNKIIEEQQIIRRDRK